jgi:hypothetical protein
VPTVTASRFGLPQPASKRSALRPARTRMPQLPHAFAAPLACLAPARMCTAEHMQPDCHAWRCHIVGSLSSPLPQVLRGSLEAEAENEFHRSALRLAPRCVQHAHSASLSAIAAPYLPLNPCCRTPRSHAVHRRAMLQGAASCGSHCSACTHTWDAVLSSRATCCVLCGMPNE